MKNTVFIISSFLLFSLFIASCDKDNSCPEMHLCVDGNSIDYQFDDDSQKMTLEFPVDAVAYNTKLLFNYIPGKRGNNIPYEFYTTHLFNIEPADLVLNKLGLMTIEYPADFAHEIRLNNDGIKLYYIDPDENWSTVNQQTHNKFDRTVSANVQRFGYYAIAYPNSCFVDDWIRADEELEIHIDPDGTGDRDFFFKIDSVNTEKVNANFTWRKIEDYFYMEFDGFSYDGNFYPYSVTDSILYKNGNGCADSVFFQGRYWLRD